MSAIIGEFPYFDWKDVVSFSPKPDTNRQRFSLETRKPQRPGTSVPTTRWLKINRALLCHPFSCSAIIVEDKNRSKCKYAVDLTVSVDERDRKQKQRSCPGSMIFYQHSWGLLSLKLRPRQQAAPTNYIYIAKCTLWGDVLHSKAEREPVTEKKENPASFSKNTCIYTSGDSTDEGAIAD